MNMRESQQTLPADEAATTFDEDATLVSTGEEATLGLSDQEATLIAPRFDDEETVHARPVVPLEATAPNAASTAASRSMMGVSRSAYARLPFATRRSLLLALVLVSVLAGGVLGGAALYFYQNHSRADEPSAGAPSQPEDSAAASQPSPAPTTETLSQSPQPPQAQPDGSASNATLNEKANEAHEETNGKVNEAASASDSNDGEANARGTNARDAERLPAAAPRKEATDESERVGTQKHGKKGVYDEESRRPRDEESRQPRRPANHADDDRRLSRADDNNDADASGPRAARRVDTIIYRPRRAARRDRPRRETASDAERLRRIFEGAP
jgi:hypothetical protein